MEKTAQRRSLLNKLYEASNIKGKAVEKVFNPQFQKVMTALRKTDNNIRSIVAGESIGTEVDPQTKEEFKGEPGHDLISLKQLVKAARSNLNRREYLMAIAYLGRFHAKLFEVANQIGSLNNNVDAVHDEFLYGRLKDRDNEKPEEFKRRTELLEHLQKMRTRMKPKAAYYQGHLVKSAGIMDFFYNLGTPRGRALSEWERNYPKETKTLKALTTAQVNLAEKLQGDTINLLKQMATARAARKPDDYLGHANQIFKKYEAYDTAFKQFYEAKLNKQGTMSIRSILDKMLPAEAAEKIEEKPTEPSPSPPAGTSALSQEETAPPAVQSELQPEAQQSTIPAVSPPSAPTPAVPELNLPAAKAPELNLPVAEVPKTPESLSSKPANDNDLPLSAAHSGFYYTLKSLSNESPRILKSYISKYAKKIQHSDPSTAIKLFKIAQNIRE